MSKFNCSSLALACTLAFGSAAVAGPEGEATIVETAVEAGSFNTLVAAVQAAGLVDTLQGEGPFTVFAPTDEAFAKLPEGTVESLLQPENRDQLIAILTYHVVAGDVRAETVVGLDAATTVQGQRVDITVADGSVSVDDATVTAADIVCSNGVIHVIDSVILPETRSIAEIAVETGNFETLVAALGAADLVDTFAGEGSFTVFAPTDDAFAKLPEGTVESLIQPENRDQLIAILTYHVLDGAVYADQALEAGAATTLQGSNVEITVRDGKAYVDGAQILITDIEASNGVIHVIDAVILPE